MNILSVGKTKKGGFLKAAVLPGKICPPAIPAEGAEAFRPLDAGLQ